MNKFGILAMLMLATGCHVTDPGHVGVAVDWNGTQAVPLQPGMNTINPITTNVYDYSTQVQVYDASAIASSNDLQVVEADLAVNYQIMADDIVLMYNEVGMHGKVESVIMRPIVQEAVKTVTAKYTAEELITKREVVKGAITVLITEQLADRNIYVTEVAFTNFTFDEDFQEAVEAKQIAEQLAAQTANEVEVAKQNALKDVAQADADAQSILLRATAQAEANRLLADSLTPRLLQDKAIQRWNGVQPRVVGGTEGLIISID